MQMDIDEALDIVTEIARNNGEGLLETMQYMDRNLFQFDSQQRLAFRVAFAEFAKLFATKE
jgi:ribosome biogenesis SPOUT family RNA methylase Rps3